MIKGIMHSADFEENTITLEIQGEFRVMAGGYVLLTDREWEELSKLHQPTVSNALPNPEHCDSKLLCDDRFCLKGERCNYDTRQ
jgi:hypothetical protein